MLFRQELASYSTPSKLSILIHWVERERQFSLSESMHALPLTSIFTKLKSMWGTDHLMRPTATNDGAIYRWREVQQNTTIIQDNGQCGVTFCGRAKVKHINIYWHKKRGSSSVQGVVCARSSAFSTCFLICHSGIAVHDRCETMTPFSAYFKKDTTQNCFINLLKSQDIFPLVLFNCLLVQFHAK
jgi:hypothetical protein